mgnify:CR=1 FL=1
MINFIKLTENDKRLIIVILLVAILAFVIVGYLSLFVKKIMAFQARRADDMLADVYKTGVCDTESKLRTYGIRKNWRLFFKQATVPFIILAAAWLLFLIWRILIIDGPVTIDDIFGYTTRTAIRSDGTQVPVAGFGTLFHHFDWSKRDSVETLIGIRIYGKPELIKGPEFTWAAWFSYIFVPTNIVGIIWLLVCVQAYIARSFRVFKLSATLFKKTLDKPMPLDQQKPNQLTNNQ